MPARSLLAATLADLSLFAAVFTGDESDTFLTESFAFHTLPARGCKKKNVWRLVFRPNMCPSVLSVSMFRPQRVDQQ